MGINDDSELQEQAQPGAGTVAEEREREREVFEGVKGGMALWPVVFF
jgi:hypothetical protein